jgi:RNA polymerase sigma factor (sigma-70 family)
MATAFRWGALGLVRHLFESGTCAGLSDARLLERFVTHRDEAAFAALLARHGSLVLNTCRTVLKDLNAADDAFQATFVLLFRKAGSIRGRDAVGAWLHRVAYRTALEAQSAAARRREVEQAAGRLRGVETRAPDDSGAVLHEEIERLPDRFRLPVVLCDLEGLTRDQAADHLGCTEGALRNRLAKGRDLLRRRLTRRGITGAVPFVAPPSLPESLLATTLRAAAGDASEAVATLVTAAMPGWILGRFWATAVVMLTLALGTAVALWGAGFLVPGGTPPTTRSQPVQAPAAPPQTAPSPLAVVGPQASPAKPAVPEKKPERPVDAGPKSPQGKPAAARTGPPVVEGRILDLEGRPIAGATVRVEVVQAPPAGKFDAFLDEVKRLGKRPDDLPYAYRAPPEGAPSGGPRGPSFLERLGLVKPPPPTPSFKATTGPDGRFRIEGLPPDGVATTLITGPGIATSEVYILTRDVPTIRVKDPIIGNNGPMIVYYGARFEHVVELTHPIVGTVRDKDTGAPIAGVHITGMPNIPRSLITSPGVEATTDAQGRYQVNGLSTVRGFKLFTEAPVGQPYVNCGFISPTGDAKPGPITFDIALKRGVLVRGRLTDKATGKPVRGHVEYYAFQDNVYVDEFPNFKRESHGVFFFMQATDGRFTVPALPGRGLITARAPEGAYLHGLGADAIKGFMGSGRGFRTYPFNCDSIDKHVLVEINPAPGTKEMTVDLQLDPGRTVQGTIVGPDDRSLIGGVEIQTLDAFQRSQDTAWFNSTFEVKGLLTGADRIDFFHAGRKLAGSLRLKGDETGKLTVKLQPWGTVVGRILDEDGNPRTNLELFTPYRDRSNLEFGWIKGRFTVDAQGRFRIEGLVPGLKYDVSGFLSNRVEGIVFKNLQIAPGEVKDLGDIKLPPRKMDGN